MAALDPATPPCPRRSRPRNRGAIDLSPSLALPEGEGASIPLGQSGEVGFRTEQGLLALTVPWGMASWLGQKFDDAVVRGPEKGLSIDGTARVANP